MNVNWKSVVAAMAVAMVAAPGMAADSMPRSEWHNLVSECVQNTQTFKDTMSKVSAEDQVLLLAEVNAAIAKLPGSDEVKAATFYAVNSEALKSASKKKDGSGKSNVPKVLAEVFATVPPEYLTVINERFAADFFNRGLSENRVYSDADFVARVKNAMTEIIARCDKAENGAVRETFAICMFVRGSNGAPANLKDVLLAMLTDASSRAVAAEEWIPQALGIGQTASYDSMLGNAGAGEEPDRTVMLGIPGVSSVMVGLLGDLQAENSGIPTKAEGLGAGIAQSAATAGSGSVNPGGGPDIGLNRIPRAYVNSKTAVGGDRDGAYRDQRGSDENPYYSRERGGSRGSEGGFYAGQGF